jgi:hypothetical protein
LKSGSICIDECHLGPALDAIARFQKLRMEAIKKRRKLTNAEDDLAAVG